VQNYILNDKSMKYYYLSGASFLYITTTTLVGAQATSVPTFLWKQAGATTCPIHYGPIEGSNLCASASQTLGVPYDKHRNGVAVATAAVPYCFVSAVGADGHPSAATVARVNNDYAAGDALLCRRARFVPRTAIADGCPDDYVFIADAGRCKEAALVLGGIAHGHDGPGDAAVCVVSFVDQREVRAAWICERKRVRTRPAVADTELLRLPYV